jgi:alanine racemase
VTLNLDYVRSNYLFFRNLTKQSGDCVPVVKGDAYGIGVLDVVNTLVNMENPQRDFFVYSLEQACEIRINFGDKIRNLYVLRGPMAGEEEMFQEYAAIPVINGLEQLHRWSNYARAIDKKLDTLVQFNAGINRSGVQRDLVEYFRKFIIDRKNCINLLMVMAHIGCQCTSYSPLVKYREKELDNFRYIASFFPEIKKSLLETNGVFNTPWAIYDCSRIGIGLFTYKRTLSNAIKTVLTVTSPVFRSKKIDECCINFGRRNGLSSSYGKFGYVYLENEIVRIKSVEDSIAVLDFRGKDLPKEPALLLGHHRENHIDGFEFSSMNGTIPAELFARIIDRNKDREGINYRVIGNRYNGPVKSFLYSNSGRNRVEFDSSGKLVKLISIVSEKRIVDVDGFCGYSASELAIAGDCLITISIGYLSGFSRKFSGTRVELFVENKAGEIVSCKLCGVVSMDQICAKVRGEDFNRIDVGDRAIVVDEDLGIGVGRLERLMMGGRDEFNLNQCYGKYSIAVDDTQ